MCGQVGEVETVLAVDHGEGESAAVGFPSGGAAVAPDIAQLPAGAEQGPPHAPQPRRPFLRRFYPRFEEHSQPQSVHYRRLFQPQCSAHHSGIFSPFFFFFFLFLVIWLWLDDFNLSSKLVNIRQKLVNILVIRCQNLSKC